jgi:PAS domain S-box-containing protein
MSLHSFMLVVAFVVYLVTGSYALWLNPRSGLHRVLFILCMAFACWAMGILNEVQAVDKEACRFWWRFGNLGGATFASIMLHLMFWIARRDKLLSNPAVLALIYLPAVFFCVAGFTSYAVVRDFVMGPRGWIEVLATDSPWLWAYIAYYLLFTISGLVAVGMWATKSAYQRETRQGRIIIHTALASLVLGTFTEIILPVMWPQKYPSSSAPIIALVWYFGLWYAILRYQFLALTPALFSRSILANMNDALFLVDVDGRIVTANRAAERLLGHAPGGLAGNRAVDILCEADHAALYPRWGTDATEDVLLMSRTGEGVPVNLSVSALLDEFGDIRGKALIGRDMRETEKLKDRVAQGDRLSAVGRLAGGVAHDFNNILTAVMGYSELVLDRLGPDDPNRKALEEIWKSGERASVLTRQLLAVGSRQRLQPRVLDLNVAIWDMDQMIKLSTEDAVEVRKKLDPALGLVRADPVQMVQVILNLVQNARDAMPQGGTLTIETSNVVMDRERARLNDNLPTGMYSCLAVSDTGTGMTPEVKARVFEPFFTTKPKGQGGGMGLSAVYGIVKQSGGSIAVQTEIGQGSTFRIFLPHALEADNAAVPAQSVGKAGGATATILLAEDEAPVRELAREILEREGYTVITAANGDEALKAAESRPGAIHMLLTDVIMPGMNGRELSEKLRAIRPEIRVLFMSGYTGEAFDHMDGKEVAFLAKPFTSAQLSESVKRYLKRYLL